MGMGDSKSQKIFIFKSTKDYLIVKWLLIDSRYYHTLEIVVLNIRFLMR